MAEVTALALDVAPCRSEALCSAVGEALRLPCALAVLHWLPVLDAVCARETDVELLAERERVGVPVWLPDTVLLGVEEGEGDAEGDEVALPGRLSEGVAL